MTAPRDDVLENVRKELRPSAEYTVGQMPRWVSQDVIRRSTGASHLACGAREDVAALCVGCALMMANGRALDADKNELRGAPGILRSMPRAARERGLLGRTAQSRLHV